MSDINKEIESRVSAFVSELTGLVRQAAIDAVAEVLGGTPKRGPGRPKGSVSAATSKPSATPKAAARGKKGSHRTPDQIQSDLDAILSYIKAHPNAKSEHIRGALNFDKAIMLDSLARLRDAKKIKMKGIRRGASYTVA